MGWAAAVDDGDVAYSNAIGPGSYTPLTSHLLLNAVSRSVWSMSGSQCVNYFAFRFQLLIAGLQVTTRFRSSRVAEDAVSVFLADHSRAHQVQQHRASAAILGPSSPMIVHPHSLVLRRGTQLDATDVPRLDPVADIQSNMPPLGELL